MNANTRQQMLDMWEKIVEHWENREPGSAGPDGLCGSIRWFHPPQANHNMRVRARRALALFEPRWKNRWSYIFWLTPGECCEERATIAAFCWALTEAGDV